MLRIVAIGLAVIAAVVVAVSLHQPPMRLMPAPAAFLDGGPNAFGANPALNADQRIPLFYATNRLPRGPQDNRVYDRAPDDRLHTGLATVRIGDDGTAWDAIYAWSTGAGSDRRPFLHLETVDEHATIAPDAPLPPQASAWFGRINQALEQQRDTDLVIYVHGANTTVERAAGQAAQLQHFTGRNSVVVLFAWPTAENFLWYSRDMVTAYDAAPHLARLIELLAEHTTAQSIDVFTYSAGGTVGSSALAIVGRDAARPGAVAPRLGEVYHAAPDADFRSFVSDLREYAGRARRVTVSANLNDSALRLSQVVNRASRAGRPDISEIGPEATGWLLRATVDHGLELLRIRPEHIPGLSSRSHTFWYDDPWISSDVLITLLYHIRPDERGLEAGTTSGGARYWTFLPDYPERLSNLMTSLRQRIRDRDQPASAEAPNTSRPD
jgi:esterase/lipase superfamily enzyme